MSAPSTEPVIRKSITVRRSQTAAFQVWTEKLDLWWPKGHTKSGSQQTEIMMEGWAGGRFYERTSDGVEHVWGMVTDWEPPHRLAYHWYLGSSPQQPTHVVVHFIADGKAQTRVEIEHRGPELVGELWEQRSANYQRSWEEVLPTFIELAHSELDDH